MKRSNILAAAAVSTALIMSSCGISDITDKLGGAKTSDEKKTDNCVIFVGGLMNNQYAPDWSVCEEIIDELRKLESEDANVSLDSFIQTYLPYETGHASHDVFEQVIAKKH